MRAILLAAGLGTRMKPHTNTLPKPLFPLGGIPLIDRLIEKLADEGIEAVLLNTHHLAGILESHIRKTTYPIPVFTRREEVLLDTGGAIANMRDFFTEEPMLVMNTDIRFHFSLKSVLEAHMEEMAYATLVLAPSETMAHVAIRGRSVLGFHGDTVPKDSKRMAFTGIQVLSPEVLPFFKKGAIFSSISAYREMIGKGMPPLAFRLGEDAAWADLGTPESFSKAAIHELVFSLYGKEKPYDKSSLAGDGSDRIWWRVEMPGEKSCIIADHGIQGLRQPSEAEAFLALGKHLLSKGIPVPEIYKGDLFAGLLAVEDLGNERLHDRILEHGPQAAMPLYEEILALLPKMHKALSGFIPEMAFSFSEYDRELILKRECGYFKEAFLKNLLQLESFPEGLDQAFSHLAAKALSHGIPGLIFRDLQSRNIMICDEKVHVIDFQGAMHGPIQYDLASLLLDPYADLPDAMQEKLLEKATALFGESGFSGENFIKGYEYARLCRNLQILGAFAFLWKVKKKSFFRAYIPKALQSLVKEPALSDPELAPILEIAMEAQKKLDEILGEDCG